MVCTPKENSRGDAAAESQTGWAMSLVVAGSVLVGALLAPHVFNSLLALGRGISGWESLRDIEFRRVLSRCIMIAVLIGVIPLLRRGGFFSRARLGIPPVSGAVWMMAAGWLGGALVVLSVLGLGVSMGAYGFAATSAPGALVAKCLMVGLVVACVEELFFRGLVFGALRRRSGFVFAAVVASAIYALAHFAKPAPPLAIVYAPWHSGVGALRHTFASVWPLSFFLAPAITLLVLGLVLCRLYERQGHLYTAMGLHAGLVWTMLMGREVLERDTSRWLWLFGHTGTVTNAWAAVPVALLCWAVVAWMTRARPEPC